MKRVVLLLLAVLPVCAGAVGGEHCQYEDYILIKYLMNMGEFERAESVIDGYLKKHPDDPFILAEKAYILKDIKGDKEAALELVEKSKAVYPDYYYSNYLHASLLFFDYLQKKEDKKYRQLADKALECVKVSLKDNPDYHESYFLGGVILNEIGAYEASNRYLAHYNRLDESPAAYYYMAFNYNKLADEQGEIDAYKKILQFNPDAYGILEVLAQMYLKRRDFVGALEPLEKLFSQKPQDKKITFDYLYSLFSAGETDRFMEVSGQVEISDYPLLAYARALILTRKEQFDEAETLLVQVKEEDPRARILLADIYQRKQEYFRGFTLLETIGEKERDSIYYSLLLEILARLNMNRRIISVFDEIKKEERLLEELALIDCYNIFFAFSNLDRVTELNRAVRLLTKRKRETPAALQELDAALTAFLAGTGSASEKPAFAPNSYLMVGLYRNRQQYDRAISLLKKTIKKEQEPLDYLELAEIYLEQKRYRKAETLLKRLLKKHPDSLAINNYYAYFLARQNKKLHLALEMSAHALTKEPENAAYIDTYGYILFRLGRFSEAENHLTKAYEKEPLEAEIIDHMVDCCRMKKRYGKIIEIYEKAIGCGVDFKERLLEKLVEIRKLKIIKLEN